MSQTLYRKWRPQRWEEVIGQEHVIQTLRNAISSDHFVHAFLFSGPRGTGKTTTARLLAKAVNCLDENPAARPCEQCQTCQAVNRGQFIDLIEIDAASNTSVDDVRDLREKVNFAPNQGRYKVYIIDEVHMLSTAAFNALLKTLEEPPPHVIFILATTEVQKIPATVLSRCQRHEFRRIPVRDIVSRLETIIQTESIQIEPDALNLVARQATGSLRDAISLLDQLASSGKPVTLDWVGMLLGTSGGQAVFNLAEAIIQNDRSVGLNHIHQTLDAGSDPRVFARQLVDHFRNILLVKLGNAAEVETTQEVKQQMAGQAASMNVSQLLKAIRVFSQVAGDSRPSWQPSLPLEMAFLDSLEADSAPPETSVPSARQTLAKSQPNQPVVAKSGETNQVSPAVEPEDVSPAGESHLTLKQINQHWREILTLIKQRDNQVQALINSCRPLGVKGADLYLGFNGDFAKNKMERADNLALVEEVISQVIGLPVKIHCLVAGQKGNELPPGVDSDGLVATALRDFGGQIVDIQ